MNASKVLAGLLRDSGEWREFFKTCSKTSAFRLRMQARQQFRDKR